MHDTCCRKVGFRPRLLISLCTLAVLVPASGEIFGGPARYVQADSRELAATLLDYSRLDWRGELDPRLQSRAAIPAADDQDPQPPQGATTGGYTVCVPYYTQCPVQATKCEVTKCPTQKTSCPQSPTKCPEFPTACKTLPTQCEFTKCPPNATNCPIEATKCPVLPTACDQSAAATKCEITKCVGSGSPTVCPVEATKCEFTVCPAINTLCPMGWTTCPTRPTVCPVNPTTCQVTVCPANPTNCPTNYTTCPRTPTACVETPTTCQFTVCPVRPTVCPTVVTQCELTKCTVQITVCPVTPTECEYTHCPKTTVCGSEKTKCYSLGGPPTACTADDGDGKVPGDDDEGKVQVRPSRRAARHGLVARAEPPLRDLSVTFIPGGSSPFAGGKEMR